MADDPWEPGTPVESNYHNWEDDPVIHPGDPDSQTAGDDLTIVDLFCGAGGFSTGLKWAGLSPILGTDIHPPSLDTFQNNHPEATVILGDMKDVTGDQLREAVDGMDVDVVAAGIPCQGFSLTNRKRWEEDDRNYLFREFIRAVGVFEPQVVLLENVTGIKSTGNGKFMRAIAQAIEESGFVVDFRTLNAADYGVPQQRRRVFFLGVREGMRLSWPGPTHGPDRDESRVTVWDAIGDLPEIRAGESASQYTSPPATEYQRLMREGADQVHNHTAPNHPESTVEKIAAVEPGEPIYKRFKQRIRLDPDDISPTQVAGGIRPQYQLGHPKTPRGLSVRERCRIQSFPDRYRIHGGTVQGRVQTGNAVPPLLARALGEEIVGILRGEPAPETSLAPTAAQLGIFQQA